MVTSATGLGTSRSENGQLRNGLSRNHCPWPRQRMAVSERARVRESAGEGQGNAATGGAACEGIDSGSEICGKEFGQTEGGYTVEYRAIEAASTENSRSAKENSGIRTAWPRKCKRISQNSSEKESKTTPASCIIAVQSSAGNERVVGAGKFGHHSSRVTLDGWVDGWTAERQSFLWLRREIEIPDWLPPGRQVGKIWNQNPKRPGQKGANTRRAHAIPSTPNFIYTDDDDDDDDDGPLSVGPLDPY